MDFGSIDRLVEVLQKAAVKGSSPVTENGITGIWRTVRGYRIFLRYHDGNLGEVVYGPPSFQGHKLNDIGSQTWAAITPEATREKFSNVGSTPKGIADLKGAIGRSIAPSDTRHEQLGTVHTVEQLVPIARSAGFNDAEISQALKGQGAVAHEQHVAAPAVAQAGGPPRVRNRLTRPQAAGDKGPPNVEQKPAAAAPHGEFKNIVDAFNNPTTHRDERAKAVAQSILDRADATQHTDTRLKLAAIGHSLNAGAMTISDARQKVDDIMHNGGNNTPVPKQHQVDVLHDRVQLKNLIDNQAAKIEQLAPSKIRQAHGSTERAKDLALADLIAQLQREIKVPQVASSLGQVSHGLSLGHISHRAGLKQLLHILRLILSLAGTGS